MPAPLFEKSSLLGPLLSLGVFAREWVSWIEISPRYHLTLRPLAIHCEDVLLKSRNTATRGDELCDGQSSRNAQDCPGWSSQYTDDTKVSDLLQSSLFQIFNSLVRASAESREGVLQYFARAININRKRAGMQVGWNFITSL